MDLPDPDHFFLNSRLGLATSWLRRWRYRMFAHRASFQGEGALLRLTNTNVRYHIRHQLRDGWVREILCRRAVEAGAAVSDGLRKSVLNASIETLIATNWAWYEPLMFARRGWHLCFMFYNGTFTHSSPCFQWAPAPSLFRSDSAAVCVMSLATCP